MYQSQQAEAQGATGGEAGASEGASEQPQEDVVDAEFSEVDEENKG